MDFAGALFAVGHKRFEFRALGLCKVYFPATRWHTPSWWSEYTKILQLSKDLLEKPLRLGRGRVFTRSGCVLPAAPHIVAITVGVTQILSSRMVKRWRKEGTARNVTKNNAGPAWMSLADW